MVLSHVHGFARPIGSIAHELVARCAYVHMQKSMCWLVARFRLVRLACARSSAISKCACVNGFMSACACSNCPRHGGVAGHAAKLDSRCLCRSERGESCLVDFPCAAVVHLVSSVDAAKQVDWSLPCRVNVVHEPFGEFM